MDLNRHQINGKSSWEEDAWRASPRERGPAHLIADSFPIDFSRFEEKNSISGHLWYGLRTDLLLLEDLLSGDSRVPACRLHCRLLNFDVHFSLQLCNSTDS